MARFSEGNWRLRLWLWKIRKEGGSFSFLCKVCMLSRREWVFPASFANSFTSRKFDYSSCGSWYRAARAAAIRGTIYFFIALELPFWGRFIFRPSFFCRVSWDTGMCMNVRVRREPIRPETRCTSENNNFVVSVVTAFSFLACALAAPHIGRASVSVHRIMHLSL